MQYELVKKFAYVESDYHVISVKKNKGIEKNKEQENQMIVLDGIPGWKSEH